MADSITGLRAQVDAFDEIYNTQRPHQGLPGRLKRQQAWDATAAAEMLDTVAADAPTATTPSSSRSTPT